MKRKISNSTDHRARNHQRIDQFRTLLDSIRVAPVDQVDHIIADIRRSSGSSSRDGPADWNRQKSWTLPVRRVSSDDEDELIPLEDDPDTSSSTSGSSSSSSSGSTEGSSPPPDCSYGPLSPFNSAKPTMDVFVERFVDAFSPQVNFKSGRAGALRRAAEIRMFSPIIGDAFDAVSVAFFGRTTRDPRIEATGFQLYPKVLRNLQQALVDPERSKAESTLVTVILLMAFEVGSFPLYDMIAFLGTALTSVERGAHHRRRRYRTCPWSCSFDTASWPGKPYVWRGAFALYRTT